MCFSGLCLRGKCENKADTFIFGEMDPCLGTVFSSTRILVIALIFLSFVLEKTPTTLNTENKTATAAVGAFHLKNWRACVVL